MFNGQYPVGSAASAAAEVLKKKFNIPQDISNLIDSLTRVFSVAVDGVSGNVSIGTIGSYIGDLALDIATLIPAAKVPDIVTALWEISGIL